MLCPDCKEKIVSRQELIKLSRKFLESVARSIQALIGAHPKRLQQSMWVLSTGSEDLKCQNFQREIFDTEKVSSIYHSQIESNDFPEKAQLRDALKEFDKSYQGMPFDFSSHLVRNWLKLSNPFSFEETSISSLLDDFADVVLDSMIITKSLTIIDGLNAASLPINFENGITIRLITNDELWNFGEITGLQSLSSVSMFSLGPSTFARIPHETWKILDIELRHDVPMVGYSTCKEIAAIRDAVMMSLRLESSGSLRTIDMGYWANYSHCGLIGSLDKTHLSIGRCEKNYSLDAGMIERIRGSWPIIRMIMESDSHYLRLPAQRLFEGSERKKQEDAILDYAIGLERLLLAEVEGELRYRFALRGATILAWENANKRTFFKNLRDFYDLRSYIVHGSRRAPPALCLSDACSYGENYLRKIWWWYVINGFTEARNGLNKGTEKIDTRILGNETAKLPPGSHGLPGGSDAFSQQAAP